MSKIKSYIESWLENCGWDLGYDMQNLPELQDFDNIADNNIDAYDYFINQEEK